MRIGWSKHVELSQVLVEARPDELGNALALMGAALLMLSQDLLLQEQPITMICG